MFVFDLLLTFNLVASPSAKFELQCGTSLSPSSSRLNVPRQLSPELGRIFWSF
jgi:hypothetical protein